MMQALYYDRDGRPVSEQRWQELGRQPGYSRIGYTDGTRHGLQVTMVTFWFGIAGHGPDGPLLFCTCAGIRGPDTRRTAHSGYGDGPPSPPPAPGTRPSPPAPTRWRHSWPAMRRHPATTLAHHLALLTPRVWNLSSKAWLGC